MLKLAQTSNGQFDLAELADDDIAGLVETLVYAAFFTDAEAPASRVEDTFDRRGWYADPKAGTGLWHVRRQPLTDAARREALAMVRTALTKQASSLTDIEVQEVFASAPAGNVSSVFIEVTGLHNGRKFIVKAPL